MLPRQARDQLVDALALTGAIPDLLLSARKISATVAHGMHGRKRSGQGESFWQFRRFQSGEPARRIDWRRSARDNLLYVREREWEAAHTVWLWTDLSASMDYQSTAAPQSKLHRAFTLMLALADLSVRSGERVGVPGLMAPTAQRLAAEKTANAYALAGDAFRTGYPDLQPVRRHGELVIFGDFLDPLVDIDRFVSDASSRGIRGHLVQIVDPSEESFPFRGRTEFIDPESGNRVTFGRAAEAQTRFVQRMSTRRAALRDALNHAGWSLLVHHTDQPPAQALMALHSRFTGAVDPRSAVWRAARPERDEAIT